jgi:urocanate hydratase
MYVLDRRLMARIEVLDQNCIKRPCYVPSYRQVVFTKGRGYSGPMVWVCVHREHHGCPPNV